MTDRDVLLTKVIDGLTTLDVLVERRNWLDESQDETAFYYRSPAGVTWCTNPLMAATALGMERTPDMWSQCAYIPTTAREVSRAEFDLAFNAMIAKLKEMAAQ